MKILKIIVTVLIMLITTSLTHALDEKFLNDIILSGHIEKAFDMLQNYPDIFGKDIPTAARIVADEYMKRKNHDRAAILYSMVIRYSSPDDDVRDEIGVNYLLAFLSGENSHEELGKWNQVYAARLKTDSDFIKEIKEIVTPYLKKRLEAWGANPMRSKWPEKMIFELARNTGSGLENYEFIDESVKIFKNLIAKKQTKDQIEKISDVLVKIDRSGIPIAPMVLNNYTNLKRYYDLAENAGNLSASKAGKACERYQAAVEALHKTDGTDTEGAACLRDWTCFFAEISGELDAIFPSGLDYGITIKTKKKKIRQFIDQLTIYRENNECKKPYFLQQYEAVLKVADQYYSAMSKLDDTNHPFMLIDFLNTYKDQKNHARWASFACFNIAKYHYFLVQKYLTQSLDGEAPVKRLSELKASLKAFQAYRKCINIDQSGMDVEKQTQVLNHVLAQLKSDPIAAIIAARKLHSDIRTSWDLDSKIETIEKKQYVEIQMKLIEADLSNCMNQICINGLRIKTETIGNEELFEAQKEALNALQSKIDIREKYLIASEKLQSGDDFPMLKLFYDKYGESTRNQAGEKLAQYYYDNLASYFTKRDNSALRTFESDLDTLKAALNNYKSFKQYGKKSDISQLTTQFETLNRIFHHLEQARRVSRNLMPIVKKAWKLDKLVGDDEKNITNIAQTGHQLKNMGKDALKKQDYKAAKQFFQSAIEYLPQDLELRELMRQMESLRGN